MEAGTKLIYSVFLFIISFNLSDAGNFINNPGTVLVSADENWVNESIVWKDVQAYCNITTRCTRLNCTSRYQSWTGYNNWEIVERCRYTTVSYDCIKGVECNSCNITFNSAFKMSGLDVVLKRCTDPGCTAACSADSHCLNHNDTYTIGVGCTATGYATDGYTSTTFDVKVTPSMREIGELCIAEIHICPSNSSCIDAKCKCNRLYKEKGGACIKIGIGDICTGNTECADAVTNSYCDESSEEKVCQCDYGYLGGPQAKACSLVYNNSCRADTDCDAYLKYSKCSTEAPQKCICDENISLEEYTICKLKVGETCVAEEDICSSNAECADAKCKCDRLYVEEEGKCTEMRIGDTCTGNDCPDAVWNSYCHDESETKTCKCMNGYAGAVQETKCELVYNSSCITDTDCTAYLIYRKCSAEFPQKCLCDEEKSVDEWNICKHAGSINNSPGVVYVHENDDNDRSVWDNIDATCHVRSTCSSYRCTYYWSWGWDGIDTRCRSVKYYFYCYYDVQCNRCSVTSNEMFYASGKSIRKRACTNPGCGPTCSASYCLNSGQTETVGMHCWRTGYETTDYPSTTFKVIATANSPPIISLKEGQIVTLREDKHPAGSYVNRIEYYDSDLIEFGDYIRYSITDDSKFTPWDYANVSRTGDRLFYLDTAHGFIYTAQNLAMEYSYTFTGIELCIADRRDSGICTTLTIKLWSCFEIPTCYDQEKLDFWDTLLPGDTLFEMKHPDPAYHFPDFNDWDRLSWTIDQNNYLDVAEVVEIEKNRAVLTINGNVTVWPSWRYRDYEIIIRVANTESCGRTTTCVLTFRISFTNWPIRFVNLPNTRIVNEDDDLAYLVFVIITYDYNYYLHDNVTCDMSFIPYEDNLFELVHDGRYAYDSWSIHRLACQNPGCGFHCDKGIGCFTYNTTLNQEFRFTVHCWDAYGSYAIDDLVLQLDYNRAPVFTNLGNSITVNSDTVSAHDILYSIQYSDYEGENLYYNFTFSPNNGIWNDELIFDCDDFGNYHNNLANISSTVYYHDMPSSIYYIYVCGSERRNMICGTLEVNIQDYCPTSPTCSGDSITVPDSTAVDTTLFTISGQRGAGSTATSLTYSFTSANSAFFRVDSASGEIKIAKTLVAAYPSSVYHITGFVYDSSACNYGSCQFAVTVEFTNHPITLVGTPYSYDDLSEDTEEDVQLVVIETADDNTDDTVTCSKTGVYSPQAVDAIPQDLFRVRETYAGSMIYVIESRELPGFTAAFLEYEIGFVCGDKHGSEAYGTLTVTIKPNGIPTFLEFPTSITVDPFLKRFGSDVYDVLTSDEENDELTFTSHVENSYVPLDVNSVGTVILRRDVSIANEDGYMYSITVCIEDEAHPLQGEVCGELNVTFISSEKYPSISNLPDSISVPENITGGTELFDVDVVDDDNGTVHIFAMTVEPENAQSLFSIDPNTGVLQLQPGSSFDFEEQNFYQITFSVKDKELDGLEKKRLTINITNVNEGPVIKTKQEILQINEDTVPGTILVAQVAECFDVDDPDTKTYSIEPSLRSSYFSVDASKADLILEQEWDLEDSSLPITTFLYIICTDAEGLSSKDYVSIEILPINEHDPVLDKSAIEVQIDFNTSVIDDLATISASDQDFGDDDTFFFDIAGVGEGNTFFIMTDTGTLRIRNVITLDYDKTFVFTIAVSDNDLTPKARTAYCTVTANYTAAAEQRPVPPVYCTTCTTEGKLVVAAMVCEALILLIIIAHCIRHILKVGGFTKGNVASSASNVTTVTQLGLNSTIDNSLAQPQRNSSQFHDNQQRTNSNDTRRDDYDDSLSDDSDIDDRLWRAPSFYPSEQPFPSGVDAAGAVPRAPSFGQSSFYA